MSTINGIGTRFYGFTKPDRDGNCKVTKWIAFMYLPFVPLKTMTIKREVTKPHIFQFNVVKYEKMKYTDVLMTYFCSWIIMPLLIGWPMILCIREVSEKMGVSIEDSSGRLSDIWTVMFAFAIIYFIIALLKLKSWDEKRGLPF